MDLFRRRVAPAVAALLIFATEASAHGHSMEKIVEGQHMSDEPMVRG
jgi:hypothetical protein